MFKTRNKKMFVMILAVSFSFIFTPIVYGLLDPAMKYCTELGYKFKVIPAEGGERGICELPDGSSVDAWDFLAGKVAKEYSYCRLKGYNIKTVSDSTKCFSIFYDECAVCVFEDGTETEVTKLMGLDFRVGKCDDGICVMGESYLTCPQDCPSGSKDSYCDGVEDSICDKDCISQNIPEADRDCPICGDEKCEAGETQENCCTDCGCLESMRCVDNSCQDICGNRVCSSSENFLTCPVDCPSGSADNYCDKVKDDICDPDCPKEKDVDCISTASGKEDTLNNGYPVYYVILTIIPAVLIAFVLYRKIQEKKKMGRTGKKIR